MAEKRRYMQSEKTRKRNAKRTELIGSKGKDKQRARHARGRLKAIAKGVLKGDVESAIHKADTIETIKRVGDYRKARADYKRPIKNGKKR